MKGLKPTFISILAIGLLAGSAVSVAAQEPPERFTSTYSWSHQPTEGTTETIDGNTVTTGAQWQFDVIESSDSRFDGTLTQTENVVAYPDGTAISVGGYVLEHVGGVWTEDPTAFVFDADGPDEGTTQWVTFVGSGSFDGQRAIARLTWRPDGEGSLVDIALDGYIIDGELPPAPGPYVAP